MKKVFTIVTAIVVSASCLFAETDPKAMKAIKAMRYGTSAKYNLVRPIVEDRIQVDEIIENTAGNGVLLDGVTLQDGQVSTTNSTGMKTDVLAEKTAGSGVTVDGVLAKDGALTPTGVVTFVNGSVGAPSAVWSNTNGIYFITSLQMGFAINGVMVAQWDDAGLVASAISEMVVGGGVTVDSVKLKDGEVYTETIRNPAATVATMWFTAPTFADPSRFGQFYDEFYEAGYIANAATTNTGGRPIPGGKFSEVAPYGSWMVTVTDGTSAEAEAITVATDGPGGFLRIQPNTKIADMVNIQLNGEMFRCNSTRDLWYETKLEIEDVSEQTVIFGLGTTDGAIDTGYPDDYMFFRVDEGTNVSFITAKNSTAVTNANITTVTDGSGTGASMVRFGLFVDGSTTSQYVYVNGTAVATNAASASIPDDEALSPVYENKMTEAVSDSIWIDFLKVINTK